MSLNKIPHSVFGMRCNPPVPPGEITFDDYYWQKLREGLETSNAKLIAEAVLDEMSRQGCGAEDHDDQVAEGVQAGILAGFALALGLTAEEFTDAFTNEMLAAALPDYESRVWH